MAEFEGMKVLEQHHHLMPPSSVHHTPQFNLAPGTPAIPTNPSSTPSPDLPSQISPTRQPRAPVPVQHLFRSESRCTSAPNLKNNGDSNVHSSDLDIHDQNRRSVKHLTCFWWKEKGYCRHSDEDCLYAHFDTGRYTDPPRQILPGEPARAGKSLERALKSLTTSRPNVPYEGYVISRPGTPLLERCGTPQSTPSINLLHVRTPTGPAYNDSNFLRSLVENGIREKAALSTAVESLKSDKHILEAGIHRLRTQNDQLMDENRNLSQEIENLRTILNDGGSDKNRYSVQNPIQPHQVGDFRHNHYATQNPIRPPLVGETNQSTYATQNSLQQPQYSDVRPNSFSVQNSAPPSHAPMFGRTSTPVFGHPNTSVFGHTNARPQSIHAGFNTPYMANASNNPIGGNNTSNVFSNNQKDHGLGDNLYDEADHIKRILQGLGPDF